MTSQTTPLPAAPGTMARWAPALWGTILGLAAGLAFALATVPSASHIAEVSVRNVPPPSDVYGAPSANSIAALALTPSIQASAAAKLGEKASVLTNARAAYDLYDKSTVVIRVTANDAERASAAAKALAQTARAEAMLPMTQFIATQETVIELDEAAREVMEARTARLERELAAATGAKYPESSDIALQLHEARLELIDNARTVATAQFNVARAKETLAPLGEPRTTRVSQRSYLFTNTLRGLLLGAILGAGVAGLGIRRKRS